MKIKMVSLLLDEREKKSRIKESSSIPGVLKAMEIKD